MAQVWDVRRKGCIHTYKGHDRGVTEVKFSPDGRWVCSGAEDGSIKVHTCMLIFDIYIELMPISAFTSNYIEFMKMTRTPSHPQLAHFSEIGQRHIEIPTLIHQFALQMKSSILTRCRLQV